jgi:hypothetical protein
MPIIPATLNVDIINPSTGPSVTVNGIIVSSYAGSNFNIGSLQTGMTVGANNNTSVGSSAGSSITTGYQNTAVGTGALPSCTTGHDNVAIGPSSLQNLVTGTDNIAIGSFSAYSQTGNFDTIAIGRDALRFCTDYANIAIGTNSLRTLVTGFNNCAVGRYSFSNTTSGSGNTGFGFLSGQAFVSGSNNTFIGYSTGDATLLNGSNNTLIGYDAEPSTSSTSNQITLGNASITSLRCAVTSITSLSDARDKKEITELPVGLEFIEGLKPVSFTWDDRAEEGKHDVKDFGFIAQDLKKSQEDAELSDVLKLVYEENPEKLEASYGKLIPILVKAIQELSAEVKQLKNK